MVSTLELVTEATVTVVGTFLIEEGFSYVIRRAAKIAGTSGTVIRDFGAAM